ncbi:alkaline phosphatase [Flavobacteriales bacterium 34_180_T64]|nr:alkaline phosphatase [Flavobacteriales bacterium 34_180_T64]
MTKKSRWENFLKELGNLVFFWCFGVLFFLFFRITFIAIFNKQLGESSNLSELFKTLFMGFRFDCTAIAYFLIIPLLTLLTVSYYDKFKIIKAVRILHQYLFVILSTLICLVTLNYFKEYNDQFNNFIFLALYDDMNAVAHTVLEDFHPVLNSISLIVIIVFSLSIFRRFEGAISIYKLLNKVSSKPGKIALVSATLLIFFIGMRGSFSKVPAIRKWAAVSSDDFLNKTILNPYRSFKYALSDFNELNLIDGKNPYLNATDFNLRYPEHSVAEIIKKRTLGDSIEKPKQIFLVVMESYDAWPLMDKYLPFKLSEQLNALAKQGTQFTNFLPASNSTFNSYGAIVSGVPYCGVNISQLGTINEPFQSSMFLQFKALGYQTNFFYGGFLSWENIGQFTKHQGVDRIFSGVDAGGVSDSGAWGIEDEKLFDLVLKHVDPNAYSLNVILTSSYHAPYAVDIYDKGFPYRSKDDLPEAVKPLYDGRMSMEEMGHLWYSDKAIGDFVKTADSKFPDALHCFTGDHYGRRFVNHQPNLYERNAVNFVMYGKGIPVSINETPGTHIDVLPTLIEKVAPKGFEYYSFGQSLFSKNKTSAIGFNELVNQNSMYFFSKDSKIKSIDLNLNKETPSSDENWRKMHDNYMSLPWYYTMKGNLLTEQNKAIDQ